MIDIVTYQAVSVARIVYRRLVTIRAYLALAAGLLVGYTAASWPLGWADGALGLAVLMIIGAYRSAYKTHKTVYLLHGHEVLEGTLEEAKRAYLAQMQQQRKRSEIVLQALLHAADRRENTHES